MGAPPSLDVLHVVLCGHVVVPLRLVVEENSQHAGVDREGFDEGVLEGEVGVEIRQGFFEHDQYGKIRHHLPAVTSAARGVPGGAVSENGCLCQREEGPRRALTPPERGNVSYALNWRPLLPL